MRPAPLELARRHAELLEKHLDGGLVGLYLTGSVALGDYRDGLSDVDAVAVLGRELALDRDGDALRLVHRALVTSDDAPHYDCTYIPHAWLRHQPAVGAETPFSLDGELHLGEEAFMVSPPTWVELAHSVRVSGPDPRALGIADVSGTLRQWTLDNLHGYWAATAAQARQDLSTRPLDQPAASEGVLWLTLGAPRLHATLATGRIISKKPRQGPTRPLAGQRSPRCSSAASGRAPAVRRPLPPTTDWRPASWSTSWSPTHPGRSDQGGDRQHARFVGK